MLSRQCAIQHGCNDDSLHGAHAETYKSGCGALTYAVSMVLAPYLRREVRSAADSTVSTGIHLHNLRAKGEPQPSQAPMSGQSSRKPPSNARPSNSSVALRSVGLCSRETRHTCVDIIPNRTSDESRFGVPTHRKISVPTVNIPPAQRATSGVLSRAPSDPAARVLCSAVQSAPCKVLSCDMTHRQRTRCRVAQVASQYTSNRLRSPSTRAAASARILTHPTVLRLARPRLGAALRVPGCRVLHAGHGCPRLQRSRAAGAMPLDQHVASARFPFAEPAQRATLNHPPATAVPPACPTPRAPRVFSCARTAGQPQNATSTFLESPSTWHSKTFPCTSFGSDVGVHRWHFAVMPANSVGVTAQFVTK